MGSFDESRWYLKNNGTWLTPGYTYPDTGVPVPPVPESSWDRVGRPGTNANSVHSGSPTLNNPQGNTLPREMTSWGAPVVVPVLPAQGGRRSDPWEAAAIRPMGRKKVYRKIW